MKFCEFLINGATFLLFGLFIFAIFYFFIKAVLIVYRATATTFNNIETSITGKKIEEPKSLKVPLRDITQAAYLSMGDYLRIAVYGLLPFIGWIFAPNLMKRFNIIDYYELRYNFLLDNAEKIPYLIKKIQSYLNQSRQQTTPPEIYSQADLDGMIGPLSRKESFLYIRSFGAIVLAYFCVGYYLQATIRIIDFLSPDRYHPEDTIFSSEFTQLIVSQFVTPSWESASVQYSWLLLSAGICLYYRKYWRNLAQSKNSKK